MKRRDLVSSFLIFPFAARSEAASDSGLADLQIGNETIRLSDVLVHAFPDSLRAEVQASEGLSVRDSMDRDRWGRRVTVITLPTGATVQARLIVEGCARVRPESDQTEFIARLLRAEQDARAAKSGIWKNRAFRIRKAETPDDVDEYEFQIVEGRVAMAAIVKGRAYLNFGDDYQTDFTVTAPSRSARNWAKRGLDFSTMKEMYVRVRGYVSWINGPSMEMTHPQQIEMI